MMGRAQSYRLQFVRADVYCVCIRTIAGVPRGHGETTVFPPRTTVVFQRQLMVLSHRLCFLYDVTSASNCRLGLVTNCCRGPLFSRDIGFYLNQKYDHSFV